MHYVLKQKARWREIMKVEAAPEYIESWDRKIQTSLKLGEYLKGLTFEKLGPLLKEGNKQKNAGKAVDRVRMTALPKLAWEEVVGYPPNPWHQVLFQRLIDRELDVDGYFKSVTVDALIEIILEVADGNKPETATPQTNLNLPEVK